jgi:cysteinyl-tRNA synthetase
MPSHSASSIRRLLLRAVLGIAALTLFFGATAWLIYENTDREVDPPVDQSATARRLALSEVRSWRLALAETDASALKPLAHDLLVVDPAIASRQAAGQDTRLRELKRRPDGGSRLLIAYLSVGRASARASYWRPDWLQTADAGDPAPAASAGAGRAPVSVGPPLTTASIQPASAGSGRLSPSGQAPEWLTREPRTQADGWPARYWLASWQALLFGSREAALDRIIEQGFDGVFLDHAALFRELGGENPHAQASMLQLLTEMAAYARARNPEFLVIVHNADELLASRALRESIDAAARANLLYGGNEFGALNDRADVESSLQLLAAMRTSGKPVLVVEQLDDSSTMLAAEQRIAQLGFLLYIAARDARLRSLDF